MNAIETRSFEDSTYQFVETTPIDMMKFPVFWAPNGSTATSFNLSVPTSSQYRLAAIPVKIENGATTIQTFFTPLKSLSGLVIDGNQVSLPFTWTSTKVQTKAVKSIFDYIYNLFNSSVTKITSESYFNLSFSSLNGSKEAHLEKVEQVAHQVLFKNENSLIALRKNSAGSYFVEKTQIQDTTVLKISTLVGDATDLGGKIESLSDAPPVCKVIHHIGFVKD